jgi:2-dehydropantoate 2-reductase
MNMVIVGAGAIGSYLGACLAPVGALQLLVRNRQRQADIARQGLRLLRPQGAQTVMVSVGVDPRILAQADIIFMTMKSHDVSLALQQYQPYFSATAAIILLQNGLRHLENPPAVWPVQSVIFGVTYLGASLAPGGEIREGGRGPTIIGQLDGPSSPLLTTICRLFETAGLTAQISDNIRGVIWQKFLVNIAINPVSALFGCSNGELLDQPGVVDLMAALFQEGLQIAKQLGIILPAGTDFDLVRKICRQTARNHSSMRQDIEQARPTEIEALNGAICRQARNLGIDTPQNECITKKIKELEINSVKNKNNTFFS